MHQVQVNTFGDVASFMSIIGGLLSITYFMIRNVILDRPGIRRLFQVTCLFAGVFALAVVVTFRAAIPASARLANQCRCWQHAGRPRCLGQLRYRGRGISISEELIGLSRTRPAP